MLTIAFISNIQTVQHSLDRIEALCRQLNSKLSNREVKIIILKLCQQVAKARHTTSEMSNGLLAVLQSFTAPEGRSNPPTDSASSNKPWICVVRSGEYTPLTPANGLHTVWR